MKRTLLFTFASIFAFSMSAQTVTFSDDFEGYNLGDYVAENSDVWETWTAAAEGTPMDALVTDEWSQSGDHSAEIRQTLLGTDSDVDLMLPVIQFAGMWELEWSQLVPSGFGGYWNVQGTASWGSTWGMDMFLEPDGTWVISQTVDGSATEYGSGSYSHDTWMNVRISFDLDNDEATVYIDDAPTNTIPYPFIIGGVDFFGLGGNTGDGLYFIDDVSITDLSVGVEEVEAFDFEVYPTPANETVNILSNAQGAAQVNIVSLSGQQVFSEKFNSLVQTQLDVSELAEGLYFVQVIADNTQVTKKIMVRH